MTGPADLARLLERPSPEERHPTGAAVWVYQDGAWRAGVVLLASPDSISATVRYASEQGGTWVDTFLWDRLAIQRRTEPVA